MTLGDCINGDLVAAVLEDGPALVRVGAPFRKGTVIGYRVVDEELIVPHHRLGARALEYGMRLAYADTDVLDVIELYPRRPGGKRAAADTDPNDPMLKEMHDQEAQDTDPLFHRAR